MHSLLPRFPVIAFSATSAVMYELNVTSLYQLQQQYFSTALPHVSIDKSSAEILLFIVSALWL